MFKTALFVLFTSSFTVTTPNEALTHEKAVVLLADGIAVLEGWNEPWSRVRMLNNPGALVCAKQKNSACDPSGFSKFDSPALGWQALQKDLDLKLRKGNFTIRTLSKRWAREKSYAHKLSSLTGIPLDRRLP